MSYYNGTCLDGTCTEDCLKFCKQAVCILVHLSKAATYILQSGSSVHSVENYGQSQTAKQDLEKCHSPCHISAAYFSICDVCYSKNISKMTHTVPCTFSTKQKHETVLYHLKPIVFFVTR